MIENLLPSCSIFKGLKSNEHYYETNLNQQGIKLTLQHLLLIKSEDQNKSHKLSP